MSALAHSFPKSQLRIRIIIDLFVGATVVTALLILWKFDPSSTSLFPPCPLRWATGWYCPGCGSLRALHQLLHGNIPAALAYNPFAVLALPFLTYGMVSYGSFRTTGRYLPNLFLHAAWIRVLGLAIILFGIVRNLPFYPFFFMAPGTLLGK